MSRYVKNVKNKDVDKEKNENDKLVSLSIDNDKLFEKYQILLT